MRDRNALVSLLLILALVAVVGGCKKSPPDTEPTPPPDTQAREERATPPPKPPSREVEDDAWTKPIKEPRPSAQDLNAENKLQTVYFAFDSSDLTPSTQSTLKQNAQVLKAYPEYDLVIQGHCDERGTIEYNLALGERRASSVRDYLASLGIRRNRIRVVSYGEERPVAMEHNESAWSRNRRAEFLLEE